MPWGSHRERAVTVRTASFWYEARPSRNGPTGQGCDLMTVRAGSRQCSPVSDQAGFICQQYYWLRLCLAMAKVLFSLQDRFRGLISAHFLED